MDDGQRTRPLARTIALGRALRPSLDRFGVTQDRADLAVVGRTIAVLASSALPGSDDVLTQVTVLPEPGPAWARRVGGRQLGVFYRFDDSTVTVLGVNVDSPMPL